MFKTSWGWGWRAEFICRTCRSLWYKYSPPWRFQATNVISPNTEWERDVHNQLSQACWRDSSTPRLLACLEQSTKSFYGPHGSAPPSLAAFPLIPRLPITHRAPASALSFYLPRLLPPQGLSMCYPLCGHVLTALSMADSCSHVAPTTSL